jgi:DNA-binding NtrC family response regulator
MMKTRNGNGNGKRFHAEVHAARRAILVTAMVKHGGNRTHAARDLGLQRTYLMRLLREYELAGEFPSRRKPRAVRA